MHVQGRIGIGTAEILACSQFNFLSTYDHQIGSSVNHSKDRSSVGTSSGRNLYWTYQREFKLSNPSSSKALRTENQSTYIQLGEDYIVRFEVTYGRPNL